MGLTKLEQETVILFNEEENEAIVSTMNAKLQKKLNQLAAENDDCVILREGEAGADYRVPKKWIAVRPPRKMSEESKQRAAERLRQYRERNGEDT